MTKKYGKGGKIERAVRLRDSKGNWIYRGNILIDCDTKEFYWVKDPVRGILITITETPKEVKFDEIEKNAALERWIFFRAD